MARTREFKEGLPLFLGVDHLARGGVGLSKALDEAVAGGGRCFMEIDPVVLYALEDKYWMPHSPLTSAEAKANQAYFKAHRREIMKNVKLYDMIFEALAARNVKVIPLDRVSLLNVRHRQGKQASPELNELITVTYREQQWVNRLRLEARPEEFALLHPNHLHRLKLRMGLPDQRLRWIHDPDRKVIERGLAGEAELLRQRAAAKQARDRSPRSRPPAKEVLPKPRGSRFLTPFKQVGNWLRRRRGR